MNDGSHVVNTTDATVSTLVDRQFVANIPLNGRSLQALINLAPGVQTNVTNSGDQGQLAVNGQRANANYFTVDGVSANVGSWYTPGQYAQASAGTLPATNIQGGFNGLVSVDDLQEFQDSDLQLRPRIRTLAGSASDHGDAFGNQSISRSPIRIST